MPRNTGTNIYAIPPDTEGIPDQTIESATYNTYIHDIEYDLNWPRPIIAGGTGANDADGALFNLGGEKSTQLVTNYDTHIWLPGSFRSAGSATAGPVDGHAFAGIVYINENYLNPPTNANVVVSARDMDDTVTPKRVYVREKKAGSWVNSGAWTVIDATTLPFPPGGGISSTTVQTAIQELDVEKASIVYVDGEITDLKTYSDTTFAPAISPILTGDPRTQTPPFGDSDDSIANTAWVRNEFAPIASPLFTGDARAPTPTVNDNDTTIATTAFVSQAVSNGLAAGGGSVDALAYSGMQINGAFDVSQENGIAPRGTTGYIVDGWILTKTLGGTGVVSFSQVSWAGLGVFPNAATCQLVGSVSTIQATLGATDIVSVTTRIEGYRIARLGWGGTGKQSITIGFWSGHAPAGLYSLSVHNAADNRTYVTTYTQATANVMQYNVITIPGEPNGTWDVVNGVGLSIIFTFAAGTSLQTSSTNQWLASNTIAATGQTNGLTGLGSSFKLAQVVVLPGTVAIPSARSALLMRPYDEELKICKRYWQKLPSLYVDTNPVAQSTIFPVEMRIAPVISGGGSGFASAVSTILGTFSQTTRSVQNIVLDARL